VQKALKVLAWELKLKTYKISIAQRILSEDVFKRSYCFGMPPSKFVAEKAGCCDNCACYSGKPLEYFEI
jgi:hypothetical protein